MKNLVFLLFLLMLISCSENLVKTKGAIAVIDNSTNSTKFVVDKDVLVKNHNDYIFKNANIQGNFKEVKIITLNSKYYIQYKGDGYKSTQELDAKVDGTSIVLRPQFMKTTCTTSECSDEPDGCIPIGTACTPCENKGKCTKTVTSD